MIKNYFIIAWRNLVKNKVYSFINILGLAAGMAVVILIGLWIWDEITFDKYHASHDRVAQVMTTYTDDHGKKSTGEATAMPLAPELRSKFGGDFKNVSMTSWNFGHIIAVGEKKISANGMWAEQPFPSMLSLKMEKGNINALDDPSSILINASTAVALFGNTDAIGKTVKIDNKLDFKVAGVFEDLPRNTTLREAKLFIPWKKYLETEEWLKNAQTQWNNHSFQTFVELAPNADVEKVTAKIKDASMKHKNAATEGVEELVLQPMNNWHLYSEFKDGVAAGGRIQFVWLFAIIGIFVLLLACINFMNLSTARSEKRAKEVGIRKAVGSLRQQLVGQFLSESILVALCAFVLSIILVLLMMPLFNRMADKEMSLPWSTGVFWFIAIAFTVITGLIAGSYPAFFLSRFEPIKVLKGTFRVGRFASLPRKVLVVIQFTFSIALIIGTIIVFKQIEFARNRPVGYNREGLLTISMTTPDLYGHYDAIRQDLLGTGVVTNMAESSSPTTGVWANQIGFNWQGKDPATLPSFGTIAVTEDFGKTIGWKLKEGRDFSRDFSDSLSIIINESAAKLINMKGGVLNKIVQQDDANYTVVGIIQDMVMESPYTPIKPTIFFYSRNWVNVITVKIKPGAPLQTALGKIETVFKKYNPGAPFDFKFTDQEYAEKFSDEQRIGNLATFFTVLAIFISCLGLFGLAAFVAEQRTKEIGVRKVLGASVFNLWQMLSKDFAWLVVISCFIAVPLAWYYLSGWLEQYEYKTDISWWVFVLACAGAMLVTIITVSFQSIRAALSNPVKSLRTE
ncbi:ABC transporter permease [Panacibacter sp. DH6]|uniref:ABC transporter permease n=1 Tax=Panacibacter microcysteis TaxID=2793269 RepID=A0A931E9C8_9BACT|nr:ABC transporter permease [Panacibacter microcysteis]MBG9377554.1 ABC transporter permease [Panacibacter microcysteis]